MALLHHEQIVSPAHQPPLVLLRELPEKSLLDKIGQISAFFLENYQKYGSIYRLDRGGEEYVVLSGLEANRFIQNEGHSVLRADLFRGKQDEEIGVRSNIVSMNGEAHYQMRKLQKPGYARSALDDKYPQLVATIQERVRRWRPGQRLLLKDAMPPLIADLLGVGVLNHETGEYYEHLARFIRTHAVATVARTQPISILDNPAYQNSKIRSMELADSIIERHRAGQGERAQPDVMDIVLAAAAEDSDLFTEQELRIVALGSYIGGMDSIAYTCAFVFYALLKHPEVMARVMAEVDEAFADGVPTPITLRQMKALYYTVWEAMRLYPVSGALQATVAQSFDFGGYEVKEGANIIVGATVTHFLPELFANPLTFDIDRYEAPRSEHRQPAAFVPFGIGPHVCLGAGMAEVFIMLALATILHQVRLVLDPPAYQLMIRNTPTPFPHECYARVVEQRRA
jgi:cytochrome P450